MKHLYYVLTARCNEKCRICPRSESERIPDVNYDENLLKLEKLLTGQAITDITLSGGEPTVYRDLPRVTALLDRLGIKTTILSNAMRLENEDLARAVFGGIVHKDNFRLITAIHSLTPVGHDGITQVTNSLVRSTQGLRNVDGLGIQTVVKCVVGRNNMTELPDYPAWAADEISERAELLFCGMDYAGMTPEQTAEFRVDFAEVRPYLEAAFDRAAESAGEKRIMVSEIPLCAVDPYYWPYFLSPPVQDSVYDDSHWQKATVSVPDISPMAEKCRQCQVRKYCSGIWRTQYEQYGEAAVRVL